MTVLAIGLVLSFSAQTALAFDLRIDYSTTSASPGGNWNSLASGNTVVASLTDFNTGLGSGVGVSGAGWGQSFSWGASPANWNGGVPLGWISPLAAIDIINKGPGVSGLASISLSGLSDTASYSIEILDNHSYNSGVQNITVQGNFANGGPGGTGNFLGIPGQNGANWNGRIGSGSVPTPNWLIWNSVTSSSGVVTINFQSSSFDEPSLNALRITGVPEPTTIALLGLGALALVTVRRRR